MSKKLLWCVLFFKTLCADQHQECAYTIEPNTYDTLYACGIYMPDYIWCIGTAPVQKNHAEIITLADRFALQHGRSGYSGAVYGFVDAARQSNAEGNIHAARVIIDFCADLLAQKNIPAMGDFIRSILMTLIEDGSSLKYGCTDQFIGDNRLEQCKKVGLLFTDISEDIDTAYQELKTKKNAEKVRLGLQGTEFFVSESVYRRLIQAVSALYANAAIRAENLCHQVKGGEDLAQILTSERGIEIRVAMQTLL